MLLAASFGLILVIILIIGMFMFRPPPSKTGRNQDDIKRFLEEKAGKEMGMRQGKSEENSVGKIKGDGTGRENVGGKEVEKELTDHETPIDQTEIGTMGSVFTGSRRVKVPVREPVSGSKIDPLTPSPEDREVPLNGTENN